MLFTTTLLIARNQRIPGAWNTRQEDSTRRAAARQPPRPATTTTASPAPVTTTQTPATARHEHARTQRRTRTPTPPPGRRPGPKAADSQQAECQTKTAAVEEVSTTRRTCACRAARRTRSVPSRRDDEFVLVSGEGGG
jgi:hypothetical protein